MPCGVPASRPHRINGELFTGTLASSTLYGESLVLFTSLNDVEARVSAQDLSVSRISACGARQHDGRKLGSNYRDAVEVKVSGAAMGAARPRVVSLLAVLVPVLLVLLASLVTAAPGAYLTTTTNTLSITLTP
ncbi:hypothetical protein E2C01_000919 [Portunus trituberculatus]|uniref:Uncharacterized protein n=1 Tax=Portunus trituberculatus TaxID=210409 RepID=A0A5B7CIW8_PORTR|nr:hypothetical protein [Portunus trituberculatus]